MVFWELTLILTVQIGLSLCALVLLFGWFLRNSNLFPLNTRNPLLTSLTIIPLILYCLIFDFTALTATTAPCVMQSLVNLMALVFYNAILLRTFSLWFQAKLAQQKFKGKTDGWFIRNRKYISNAYSAGYLLLNLILFWVPSIILASQGTARPLDPTVEYDQFSYGTFSARCAVASTLLGSRIVYTSCSIAWILQAVLLWKVREIQENLKMKKEIKISCANNLMSGILAIALTYGGLWRGMPYLGVILVCIEMYAAMVIPLKMAAEERKPRSSTHGVLGSPSRSTTSISIDTDFVEVILHSLGESQELYEEFKKSLLKEFAVENLLFLEDVSKLNQRAKPSVDSIRAVVDKFLASGADYEVNHNLDIGNQLFAILNNNENQDSSAVMDILNKIAKSTMQDLRHGALMRFKRNTPIPNSSVEATSVEVAKIPTSFPAEFVN
eukprot:TRINITY_DN389_c0_g1_i1.p1 TRINITY_DN389_c0_g1~~TRINITY_DN389_c0_g1_i1.p1  ORF type:complete len:440 (-),score=94.43 TRINITY_DN389_c0_g1_i1:34-1353(-)